MTNNNGTVSKFAPGSTTATATLQGLSGPIALAFDARGDLFVTNNGNGTVSEFAPGSTTATTTLTGLNAPWGLAFDSNGNLFVVNEGSGTVSEFTPGATTASGTLIGNTELTTPTFAAFDLSGNLYVPDTGGFLDSYYVAKFTPGSGIASTTATAGGVIIQSSVESRPMLIGGTNSNPVAGINLTSAELAQIETTASGTVTIGDSSQAGNITFSTATLGTTAGAAMNVVQSTSGGGQITLDEGASNNTALNGNGGTVSLTAGSGGIRTTLYSGANP